MSPKWHGAKGLAQYIPDFYPAYALEGRNRARVTQYELIQYADCGMFSTYVDGKCVPIIFG